MAGKDRISEILEIIKREKVRFIDMSFTDIHGKLKKVTIPAERAEEAMEHGVPFDGSSIEGYALIEESDLLTVPDLDTFMIYPWTDGLFKTARFLCDIYYPDGKKRYEGDPRYVLQRQSERAKEMGFRFYVGPEYEFFIFKYDENGKPTNIPPDTQGYFDMGCNDETEMIRKECIDYFQMMGYEVEADHHEVAPGQHEIDLKYDEALKVADSIATLKYVIKTVADRHGYFASFMPKPIYGVNGNGMHVNQSLASVDANGNTTNAFWDPSREDELSDAALYYLGGLMEHIKEATAIYNAYVNSYKRLVPGYEAPVYISWARKNRSTLIRVPSGKGKSTRLELRNPDPAGNPYLMFAAMLASGLDGIEKKIEPPEPIEGNVFSMSMDDRAKLNIDTLPGNLGEAITELEKSQFMKEVLGEHVYHHYLVKKKREWNNYRAQVTKWELENYLPIL